MLKLKVELLDKIYVASGRTVALLGLIDSATPPYSGQRPHWHEALLDPVRDALRVLRWGVLAGWRRTVPVALLPGYRGFVAAMTGWANRRYHPQFFPGTVTLFLTTDEKYRKGDRRELISKFAQVTRQFVVPGKRSALFVRPGVDELAAHFKICLAEADKNFPPKK